MKFTIKYADKIIGALVVIALGTLVFVIFMLGSSQRWFSRDFHYKTYFLSANGLSPNMSVQYKGFTIGHVKSISLSEDDQVEVIFTIFDTYNDRVTTGSLVELNVSPIGALGGSSFLFHPGLGDELVGEGGYIPEVNSYDARQLMAQGLSVLPGRDDSINNIITLVGTTLESVNVLMEQLQDAFAGTTHTSLGRTLGGVEQAVVNLPQTIDQTINDLMDSINPILASLNELTTTLTGPDGTVMSILDSQGPVYHELTESLSAISGILQNLEKTTDFIPSQLPQVAVILTNVSAALKTAQDVLVSLTNNPLLKGGVPEYKETKTGGVQPRDLNF
jgi:phospholipid/cholesterol/gamma-HCH transport system substrate-binding protein